MLPVEWTKKGKKRQRLPGDIFEQDGIKVKYCGMCKGALPIEQFHKCSNMKTGLANTCKPCTKEYDRNRAKDPKFQERKLNRQRRYHDRHRERINRSKHGRPRKGFAGENPGLVSDPVRLAKHYEKLALRAKTPKHKAKKCIWVKNRNETDPAWKMKNMLRGQILHRLRAKRKKPGRTEEILGCSMEEFKQWIESKWCEGMNWNNHGRKVDQWSLDHTACCALFDLMQDSHIKACFNYRNTLPMWHRENVRKNDRLPDGRRACQLTKDEKRQALIELGFAYLFEEVRLDPTLVPFPEFHNDDSRGPLEPPAIGPA